ncbi:hypothetical protein H8E88_05775, partial [candidate division KSB1 bacterium]|nr:hypothetical protein [candidate division KSB1 bacterium]
MFYRRKIILALLQSFGNELGRTELQKYLFLFSQMQEKPSFEFVPYKFGCYSFQSLADKSAMTKSNLLADDEKWVKKEQTDYLSQLDEIDKLTMQNIKSKFINIRGNELIKYVYLNYPYYAINSEIATDLLTTSELEKVIKPSALKCRQRQRRRQRKKKNILNPCARRVLES